MWPPLASLSLFFFLALSSFLPPYTLRVGTDGGSSQPFFHLTSLTHTKHTLGYTQWSPPSSLLLVGFTGLSAFPQRAVKKTDTVQKT